MISTGTIFPAWVIEIAKEITIVVTFLTMLGVLAKYGPIRRPIGYIWRRLVAEPIATWLNKIIHDAVAEELEKRGEPPKE